MNDETERLRAACERAKWHLCRYIFDDEIKATVDEINTALGNPLGTKAIEPAEHFASDLLAARKELLTLCRNAPEAVIMDSPTLEVAIRRLVDFAWTSVQ